MPRASAQQSEAKEKGERSSRLRPGRVHRTNASPPHVTGTARDLFRLVRLVSRSSPGSSKASSSAIRLPAFARSSPFQRRAIVNVRGVGKRMEHTSSAKAPKATVCRLRKRRV
jgi:hypothetical protein